MSDIQQVPLEWQSLNGSREHRRRLAQAINQLISQTSLKGRINLTSPLFEISDERISESSIVIIVPIDFASQGVTHYIVPEDGKITVHFSAIGNFTFRVIL